MASGRPKLSDAWVSRRPGVKFYEDLTVGDLEGLDEDEMARTLRRAPRRKALPDAETMRIAQNIAEKMTTEIKSKKS